jgi:hypothetical protein
MPPAVSTKKFFATIPTRDNPQKAVDKPDLADSSINVFVSGIHHCIEERIQVMN